MCILLTFSPLSERNSIRRDFEEVSTQFPSLDRYTLDVANSEVGILSLSGPDRPISELTAWSVGASQVSGPRGRRDPESDRLQGQQAVRSRREHLDGRP